MFNSAAREYIYIYIYIYCCIHVCSASSINKENMKSISTIQWQLRVKVCTCVMIKGIKRFCGVKIIIFKVLNVLIIFIVGLK